MHLFHIHTWFIYIVSSTTSEQKSAAEDDGEGEQEPNDSEDKESQPIHTLPLKSKAILAVPPLPDGG